MRRLTMPRFTLSQRGLALALIPALTLVGAVFYIAVAAPGFLANQPYPATPQQPIPFNHQVHVQVAGLQCATCHRTAGGGVSAGMPSVQQCIACHVAVSPASAQSGQASAAIQQLQVSWASQQPIDWQRIYRLPDHTRFDHSAHVQAGVSCATCHGNVAQMQQVVQVRPLKMGDCVACHQQPVAATSAQDALAPRRQMAPTSCGTCHY